MAASVSSRRLAAFDFSCYAMRATTEGICNERIFVRYESWKTAEDGNLVICSQNQETPF